MHTQTNTFPNQDEPAIISYRELRRTLGCMGILLPFVLMLGSVVCGCEVQPSISHYYYTNMREIFEGTLFAYSLFLFSYKGYDRPDRVASNLAAFFCLGVALFPTNMLFGFSCQQNAPLFIDVPYHDNIHFACASLFFGTLAYISIFLFTKSNPAIRDKTEKKIVRNKIYRVCGVIMIVSIVFMGVYLLSGGNSRNHMVIIFETFSLLAFGTSWLIKGETLFRDEGDK